MSEKDDQMAQAEFMAAGMGNTGYNTNSDKEPAKVRDPNEELKILSATRKLAKILEQDKLRDDIKDELNKERLSWRQPGGLQKKMEKYGKTKDGQSGNRVLDFLTSSDPMNGIGQMMADSIAYDMMNVKNDARHNLSSGRVYISARKSMKMSSDDSKIMAAIIDKEMRYGNAALDSARSKSFIDKYANDQGNTQPSI